MERTERQADGNSAGQLKQSTLAQSALTQSQHTVASRHISSDLAVCWPEGAMAFVLEVS